MQCAQTPGSQESEYESGHVPSKLDVASSSLVSRSIVDHECGSRSATSTGGLAAHDVGSNRYLMPTRDPSHGKDQRIGVEECPPPGTITTRRPGCGTLVPALKTTVRQAGAPVEFRLGRRIAWRCSYCLPSWVSAAGSSGCTAFPHGPSRSRDQSAGRRTLVTSSAHPCDSSAT
jgi:hypothetical protein